MKKAGKVTVKHFLNKNLKPSEGKYPVYVTIWFQNKLTRVKSHYMLFCRPGIEPFVQEGFEFADYMDERTFDSLTPRHTYYKAMEREKEALQNIVRLFFEKFGKNIVSHAPGEFIRESLRSPFNIVSGFFKNRFRSDLDQKDPKNVLLKHMISWGDVTFPHIYDVLYSLSNDGMAATRFYHKILSEYTSGYNLTMLLYDFNIERDLRFWQWMDNPDAVEDDLRNFFKSKKVTASDIDTYVSELHEGLTYHLHYIKGLLTEF